MRRIKSFCQSNSSSFLPTSLPSGMKQTVSINSMISAALTASSACFRLRLATDLRLYLPWPRVRSLLEPRTGCTRYHPRTRGGTQLTKKVRNVLGHHPVLGSEGDGLLATVLLLCP